MTHVLAGGVTPEDEDLASAWCDQGCEVEAPTVSEAIALLTCTNDEAAAGLHPDDGQTTHTHEKEQIVSDTSIAQTADNVATPRSVNLKGLQTLRTQYGLTIDDLAGILDTSPARLYALENGKEPITASYYAHVIHVILKQPRQATNIPCITKGCVREGLGHVVDLVDYERGDDVVHRAFQDARKDWSVDVSMYAPRTTWGVWAYFETESDDGVTCDEWKAYSATVTGAFQLAGQLNEEAAK